MLYAPRAMKGRLLCVPQQLQLQTTCMHSTRTTTTSTSTAVVDSRKTAEPLRVGGNRGWTRAIKAWVGPRLGHTSRVAAPAAGRASICRPDEACRVDQACPVLLCKLTCRQITPVGMSWRRAPNQASGVHAHGRPIILIQALRRAKRNTIHRWSQAGLMMLLRGP
jgi:hypothetical protein